MLEDNGQIFDLEPGGGNDPVWITTPRSRSRSGRFWSPPTEDPQHRRPATRNRYGENWRCSDVLLMTRTGTLSASLLFRPMASGGGVLAIEDITERKKAQAELDMACQP